MATLCLDTINKKGETQKFTLVHNDLISVLDMANELFNNINVIVGVSLFENGKARPLPIHIIDGQSLSIPTNQLIVEWELIMAQGELKQIEQVVAIMKLRIDVNEHHLAYLERDIARLRIKITELLPPYVDKWFDFEAIIGRYEKLIALKQLQLDNAFDRRKKNVQRLADLVRHKKSLV